MKKLLVFVLILAMTSMIFTGCGQSKNEAASNEGAQETAGGSSSSSENTDTSSDEEITITMMVSGTKAPDGQDFETDMFPALVKEAFPNITVEVTKMPDKQYVTAVKTKLASGQAPDIFWVWPKSSSLGVIPAAEAGFVKDLSDYDVWENIAQGAQDDMSYNGSKYAVCTGISLLGTYYNKDLFAQVGITEEPQNWEEFLADCQILKDNGITPIVMGDKDSGVMQFGLYQLAANVLYPENPDFDLNLADGSATFSDSEWNKIFEMYYELYEKGYVVENSLGLSSAQAIQSFIDGQAAMIFDGSWDYTSITNQGAVDFERGYMPLPGNDAGDDIYVSAASAGGYAVSANTEYTDEIQKIFELWFDGESDLFTSWTSSLNAVSVYDGVPLQYELLESVYNAYAAGNSYYFCNQMWPGGLADEMTAGFGETIGTGKAVENITEAMDRKYQELNQ